MKKIQIKTRERIFRTLGVILGMLFISVTLMSPGHLNIINVITFVVIGVALVLYGITGKTSFRRIRN